MFGIPASLRPRTNAIKTLSPREIHDLMASTAITLVDVREVNEHRSERIPGAINVPLSQLQAQAGQIPTDKPVILHRPLGRSLKDRARPVRAHGAT